MEDYTKVLMKDNRGMLKVKLLFFCFLFLYSKSLFSQSTEDFRSEFKNAASKKFSDKELNRIFKEYSEFLTPHSDINQLVGTLKGQSIDMYPLAEFKADPIYKSNIAKLLTSKNPNKRVLSYLVIAASGDLIMENELLDKIKTERNKNCLMWAGLALLHINTTRTTVLFDFIIENENFDDMHMYPMLLKLNKDSLMQTAYSRINSKELKARILAAQILSKAPANKRTEAILLKAVNEWDMDVKGYAIYSIKELQVGNLLEALKPLLENKQTRGISLEALANSPTEEDRDYLFGLVNSKDTIPSELLDCFFKSKNIESLKYWLELTHTKAFPKNYYFSSHNQPMLHDDDILTYLHNALLKVENPEILDELVRALEGRTDSTSTDIMLRLLQNKNSNVRYWTANTLKGNRSIKLVELLPHLLGQPSIRVVSMTELAIENKIDSLNSIYEDILENDPNPDWRRSSLEYLSNFPKAKYISMFKELLENHQDDFYTQRMAALGLGRLRDESSVDLIISALRRESVTSDFNTISYLNALNLVKGDKARIEIERFKFSKEKIVKELVADILNKW